MRRLPAARGWRGRRGWPAAGPTPRGWPGRGCWASGGCGSGTPRGSPAGSLQYEVTSAVSRKFRGIFLQGAFYFVWKTILALSAKDNLSRLSMKIFPDKQPHCIGETMFKSRWILWKLPQNCVDTFTSTHPLRLTGWRSCTRQQWRRNSSPEWQVWGTVPVLSMYSLQSIQMIVPFHLQCQVLTYWQAPPSQWSSCLQSLQHERFQSKIKLDVSILSSKYLDHSTLSKFVFKCHISLDNQDISTLWFDQRGSQY